MTRCVSALFRSSPGLFVAWILVSATQPKAAYILDSIPLEVPITSWFPADVDDDGIWELAIAIESPDVQVGIINAQSRGWQSGPFQLPVTPDKWGVADIDDDEVVEYIYLWSDTVRVFDPSDGSDAAKWVAGFQPTGLFAFGRSEAGASIVGLSKGYHFDSTYDFYGFTLSSGHDFYRTQLHELVSGAFVDSLPGSAWRGGLINSFRSIGEDLFLLSYHLYEWSGSISGRSDKFIDSVYVITPELSSAHSLLCRNYWSHVGGPPRWSYIQHVATSSSSSQSPGFLIYEMSGVLNSQWEYEPATLRCARADSPITIWSRSSDSGFGASPYHDFAIFDLDGDGSLECYLPLKATTTWEIRELDSGLIVDTLENMPAVDLRTGPLLASGEQNLFYFSGPTLYFYKPDSETGVFDDPESPLGPAVAATISSHPNPFNSAVTVTWSVSASTLTIFNVLGQAITEISVDGRTSFTWDGCDSRSHECPSGIYVAQVASRDFTVSTKIVLLR